ncbi:MAG: glucose PTS transporter subunit IIA [Tissierellia bacterium]|nr:glucose PTS transporter subunit IIA [Tissierellia bacterium]
MKDGGKKINIYAPAVGKVVSIKEVPDTVFSNSLIGEGFAVKPEGGIITSPVSGEVTVIPETIHAIGITTDRGAEVLIHFSTNSVELEGKGLSTELKVGDRVEVGDIIIKYDDELIKDIIKDTITPVVVTNISEFKYQINLDAKPGKPVMKLKKIER